MPDYNERAVRELRWIRYILLTIALLLLILIFAVTRDIGQIALLVAGGATMIGLIGKSTTVAFLRTDLHITQRESIDDTPGN